MVEGIESHMSASQTYLEKAITGIDLLVEKLENGSLAGPSPGEPVREGGKEQVEKATKKQKKQKKQKGEESKAAVKKHAGDEIKDVIQKALLVVAQVDHVEAHPNSDKLIITRLNCGDHQRQIVAGLQQHVDMQAFLGSKVVCIINLKTAKLGGEVSEGMILASTRAADGQVQPICPPSSAEPGSMVYPENICDADKNLCPKTLKGDMWRKIVPELEVVSGTCCYKGVPLHTTAGPVLSPGVDKGTIS